MNQIQITCSRCNGSGHYSFNLTREADLVDQAIAKVLEQGLRTGDIMQDGAKKVGTKEMGDAIIAALESLSKNTKAA